MELNTIQSSYLKKSITAKARIVPAGTIAISQRREPWETKPGTHKSRQGRHRLAVGNRIRYEPTAPIGAISRRTMGRRTNTTAIMKADPRLTPWANRCRPCRGYRADCEQRRPVVGGGVVRFVMPTSHRVATAIIDVSMTAEELTEAAAG